MTLIKAFILTILLTGYCAYAQTRLTVAQGGEGMFTTISSALEAAGPGYVIEILDNAVYEEQVTIDSTLNGLTLTSSNPTSSSRPVIMWQDTENVHPKNATEAQDTAIINYDRNGALRVLRARNVTIDGIIVDGGGAMPFGYDNVWQDIESTHPLFHGNAAICLWRSGNVVIRNSDVRNAFYGIAVNDRNAGGIFGNPNPSSPPLIIPGQNFGQTGNHLIEHNHIHGNSWGIYMESVWDLGSTIRFNFIYDNYHQSPDIVSEVLSLDDGEHNPGGAINTKDHNISPLAIYNNTFHNNYLTFGGHWRAGAQHLVFNNIYSSPKYLWADGYNGEFTNPWHTMDPLYPHRMKHSIYAAQASDPVLDERSISVPSVCRMSGEQQIEGYTQVHLMAGIDSGAVQRGAVVTIECDDGSEVEVVTNDFIAPGALIDAPEGEAFPASATIRWFEIQNQFLNTDDPTHPNFLMPDWDHPLVDSIVKNAGWSEAGMVKGNGSIVDIGAAQSAPVPTVFGRITPVSSVFINNNNIANLVFDLAIPPDFSNPRIRYLRFLRDVEYGVDSFGNSAPVIAATSIEDITPPSTTLRNGANSIDVSVEGFMGFYGFFEMVIEGEGPDGQTVTTDVGFLPYIQNDYLFNVKIVDMDGDVLDTVIAGERVGLRLAPMRPGEVGFTETLTDVNVQLNSGNTLYSWPDEGEEPTDPLEITQITDSIQTEVVFTRVPRGGSEYISAMAVWMDEGRLIPFFGSTNVVVVPGAAENVVFEDPPSTNISDEAPIIDPGSARQVQLRVFDRFGNAVNVEVPVTIESLDPEIGDISGPVTTTTDPTGAAFFNAEVTNGTMNDIFTLRATLEANGATDEGRLRIGRYTSVTRKPGSFPPAENFIASPLNPQTPAVTKPEFAVAPNPVNRNESISFYTRRLNYTSAAFSIYDASGNLVKETKARRYNNELPLAEWTSSLTYDLVGRNGRPLAPGSYMVIAVFTTEQGESVRFRETFGVVR
ncbi:hypothetical protein QA601_07775 [Chitinispirillales bacterium ANBcel5]|uniref:hypothetical protein n=1 Tax=Cellulosispirillum alkaliphilum TaxID=3039283 RepID=UPI002A5353CC|nr:hypothetical protein [Chitinispirillales bacterium ANBcel5]